jgi:hypothetical protein
LKYVAVMLLVVACGRSTDAEFAPYVEEFRSAAAARGVAIAEVPVEFGAYGEVPPHAMAMCESLKGEPIRVVVAKQWWDYYADKPIGRRLIVFHELGHCALGRDHANDRDSVMNEGWSKKLADYEAKWGELVDELFR